MSNDLTKTINDVEVQIGGLSQSVAELRNLIERAGGLAPGASAGPMTLHEAMAAVLRQRGNEWTKISDLAEMINAQGLYAKGDGSPVESNQLHARANRDTYRNLFEKNGPMLRLRQPAVGEQGRIGTGRRGPIGYEARLSNDLTEFLAACAELCRLGRDSYFEANKAGFNAHPETEAQFAQAATELETWPGGAWPASGPAETLHQVGLMLANSAGGRLGEMGSILESGEVAWSLPTHSRGVLEVCSNIFRIYVQPFVGHFGTVLVGEAISNELLLQMYASAHLLILDSAFNGKALAASYLDLDPSDPQRQADLLRAESEVARITGAYVQHHDSATSDVSSPRRLRLSGTSLGTTTALVDQLAEWMWPDPSQRPKSLYKVLSGHAHTSLDSDLQLYKIDDEPGRREMTRFVTRDFIANSVFVPVVVFQGVFARLVGYYGWSEEPLHAFSERIAEVFPAHFRYGDQRL
ncbi:MAG: hypothetical protein ACE37B_14955 [Ilumatobacter sp.]|uniref:hypothetical protein n=1 Tax=Ilumatobacter sp. TaxID=1967498 RepID=UPI00391919A4